MARVYLLVPVILFCLNAFGFGIVTRPTGIKSFASQQANVPQQYGMNGVQVLVHQQFLHLNRYIKPCLIIGCDLSVEEKETLERVLEVWEQGKTYLIFATDSADLFSQLPSEYWSYFEEKGFSPDKELFHVSTSATHRVAISLNEPGPIIFNKSYFIDAATAVSGEEALSYLIHEMGHQTGLGYESEALLDRLGQKVARHVTRRGGESQKQDVDFKIWTDNLASPFEHGHLKEIDKNKDLTMGPHIYLYNDEQFILVSSAVLAAFPNLQTLGADGVAYVWTGVPRFQGLENTADLGMVQVLVGNAWFYLNSEEDGITSPLQMQYRLQIPVEKNQDQRWSYVGRPVVAEIFDLRQVLEEVITVPDGYKVLSTEHLRPPEVGFEFALQCPEKPASVGAVFRYHHLRRSYASDAITTPSQPAEFISQELGVCRYRVHHNYPGFRPRVNFEVEQFLVRTKDNKNILLPPPNPLEFNNYQPDREKPVDVEIKENILAWGVREADGGWRTFEEIMDYRNLNPVYLSRPDHAIIWDLQFKMQNSYFCGGSFVMSGTPSLGAHLADKVYYSTTFPSSNETELNLFQDSHIEHLADGSKRVVAVFNSRNIQLLLGRSASVEYFSLISCEEGPIYFHPPQ